VAEGGALLRRYMGLNPYRGFESLSLRHTSFQARYRTAVNIRSPSGVTFSARDWGKRASQRRSMK
jgi:hypothetical protein